MPRSLRRLRAATLVVLAVVFAIAAALILTAQYAIVLTRGVSMNPVYYQGDLVVVHRESHYTTGEIVAYHRSDLHLVVLHRIIGGDAAGWTFKGDNNQSVDPTKPAQHELIGRAVLHVPHGGTWLRRLTAPPLLAAYTCLLLLGGASVRRTRRRRRKDRRLMSTHRPARSASALLSLPPLLRTVAAGVATLGILGALLSGLSWTRPTHHVVAAAGGTTSSMRFSYIAHVPLTPAYDATTVTAPQPVFRKVTDAVDVTFSYAGLPGALTVNAELSTASGWRTTLPLHSAIIGRTYEGVAHLDLAALQQRADAAASATGLPAGEVSVAVVPQISLAGGGSFAPRFELSLTDLVLKPTGNLNVAGDSATSGQRMTPERIAAFGYAPTVTIARIVGTLVLLLSVLVLGALAAVRGTGGPVNPAERVRARYRDLLLPVLPVDPAAGRHVVDVPDLDSLFRLAERYGLLVMHWCEGGVGTYVVQDESTSYRYRGKHPADEGPSEAVIVPVQMTP